MLSLRIHRARLGGALSLGARYHTATQKQRSITTSNQRIAYLTTAVGIVAAGAWWFQERYDNVPRLNLEPSEPSIISSEAEVTRKLSQDSYSIKVTRTPGVDRYDGARLASNNPCEDYFIHGQFPSPRNDGSTWMAWAVLDGHSGWQTADLLEKRLVPAVQSRLSQMTQMTPGESIRDESIQRAIMEAFVNLDDDIVKPAVHLPEGKQQLEEKMRTLAPAQAGSCALLAIYDPTSSKLHVACTGDSRAVLGQKSPEGRWEAIPLSTDQTGKNPDEINRLRQEHPGEQDVVKNGRVLGLAVSRAFGDGRYKWPLELQKPLGRMYYGFGVLDKFPFQTPPYITAEPVVTSTTIDNTKKSFLILGSDGLWDNIPDQPAVDLVGKWLAAQGTTTRDRQPLPEYAPFDFSQYWKGVPWWFVEERTTIQDDNVAVHLMRNVLGGNHHEMLAGRLSRNSPWLRNIKDDITIQVVFFK